MAKRIKNKTNRLFTLQPKKEWAVFQRKIGVPIRPIKMFVHEQEAQEYIQRQLAPEDYFLYKC